MAVQDATAGAICEYAMQVHGVPVDARVLELDVDIEIVLVLELAGTVFEVLRATRLLVVLDGVKRQEQALEILDTEFAH